MWETIVNDIVLKPISQAWQWFDKLLEALPGAFGTIAFMFVIYAVSRYFIVPLFGGYRAAEMHDFIDYTRNGSRSQKKKGKSKNSNKKD